MFGNKKIITIDTLQQHTSNIIKEVESYVVEKNLEIQNTIQSEIKSNDSALRDEISERKLEDQKLQQLIENQTQTIGNVESNLSRLVQTEKNNLELTISTEINNREDADSQLKTQFESTISSTTEIINSSISLNRSEVTSEYKLADQTIQSSLNQEVNERKSAIQDLQSQLNSEIARREVGDKLTQEILETHLTNVESLPVQLTEHKENKNNPHGVNPEQIGAAKQADLLTLSNKISEFETVDLTEIKNQIESVESELENLSVNNILANGSNQTLTGDLTLLKTNETSGNLVVEGDLVVKGSTRTVKQETLEVSDSLIVVNSDGQDLTGINSGIAILTSPTEAYGIIYNSTTDSINLGSGQINKNGDFIPFQNESHAILTRANNSELINGHVLIWDANNNRVIDGGVLPNKTELSKEFILLTDYNKDISTIQNNILILNNKDAELTTLLNNLNISIDKKVDLTPINIDGTYQLNTIKKNIIDAINENKNSIDSHISSTDNPHNVTLEQLNGEPKIAVKNSAFNQSFADTNPLMNGEASSGTSILISRADHIHPTDNTRAPLDHSSEALIYGIGTASKYGHVKVDNSISSTSTNPVQNNVIKNYVDEEVAKKVPISADVQQIYATDASGNQTSLLYTSHSAANSIALRDAAGRVQVGSPTHDYHATNKEYVNTLITGVTNDLEAVINQEVEILNTAITNQEINFSKEIERLETLDITTTNLITEEANKRIAADDALAIQLNQKINDTISTMNAPLVNFLRDLLNQDSNTRYVASWKEIDGIATPYWVALDEGELN